MSLLYDFIVQGVFLPELQASTYETPTDETIFDHIRRKSKDFPLITKLDCMESIVQKKELFTHNHLNSLNFASDKATETDFSNIVRDNIFTSYMESVDVEKHSSGFQHDTEENHNKFEGFSGIDGVLNISERVSITNPVLPAIHVPALSTVLKDKKRPPDPRSFTDCYRKQHCSSRESEAEKSSLSGTKRHCCSLETAGNVKEVDSNLGFKSVFSFL